MKNHKNIMILGTSSGAGKSIITTGLCRVFHKDGYSTTPFKSQNMALNSFVTEDGLEIGRSQAVQAYACGLNPSGYMNPLLLKPCGNNTIQIVLNGKSVGNMSGYDFSKEKTKFKKDIMAAYKKAEEFDICVLEGAGSPVEINIKENDIVNMGMAEMADAPVILVADIDRGGVFASVVGTMFLLEPHEKERVKGVVINKFRGRKDILEPGMKKLEELIKVKVLGVVPYSDFDIEDEDRTMAKLEKKIDKKSSEKINIAIINLKHLSNFTDIDPLKKISDVNVSYADEAEELDGADIVIIPGSKNTISDMEMLRKKNIDKKIIELKEKGKVIIGICGGFQILGKKIEDESGVEGKINSVEGLGFFDMNTVFFEGKTTTQYKGKLKNCFGILKGLDGKNFFGYEIHNGKSFLNSRDEEKFLITDDEDIKGLAKDNIFGTYIHGIFENNIIVDGILNIVRKEKGLVEEYQKETFEEYREKQFDKLEKVIRENIDIEEIYKIMNDWKSRGKK